jgi:hypothetical protein
MFHAYGWQVSYTTWVKIGDTTVKIWVSDIGIDRKNAFTRTQQNLMDKIHKLALT